MIKKSHIKFITLCMLMYCSSAYSQDKSEKSEKGDDRNVMLNAASANAGPRNVNIGLPASVGGTTVLENNLPVVYIFWPELPVRSWRMDAMTNGVSLLDLGQTAINIGDVGFSVGTTDNLGTDELKGNALINSNSFGLLNGSANISGPLNKKGLKLSVGAYVNYDPGTYKVNKNHIDKYFSDQMQMYKGALSQDYNFNGGKGSIALLYKYAKNRTMTMQQYAPYRYKIDGSVSELDGFKIGGDNYIMGQKFEVKDAKTGDLVTRDALKDFGTESSTIDLIGKNQLNNGLNINYIVRYHYAKSGVYLPIMTGVTEEADGSYTQSVMALGSKSVPLKSLTSLFEVGKKSGNHDWKIGMNQWTYNIDNYVTEGTIYNQTVAANPKLVNKNTDGYKDGYNTGSIYEYHNGSEYKTALILTDKWEASPLFTLNLGARIEYQKLSGDYIDNKDFDKTANIPYLSSKKTKIDKDFVNKAFMVNAVYKMTKSFGLLGDVTYNEQGGRLENYSAGSNPHLKKSKIPGAGLGVFYNHPMFSLVSKATYIKRDEYRATVNFTSPTNTDKVERAPVSYGIETLGWTTDVVGKYKGFNLHLLLTIQSPKYKDYTGTVNFTNGDMSNYNFSDNIVSGISKVLIEIDPSYEWNKLRVWASARYFGKQYANLTNSLEFASRWETFMGASYKIFNNLELSASVVNLLNQRGAQGTISGSDLWTKEYVDANKDKINNSVVSGTYIRPFTAEFGLKYNF